MKDVNEVTEARHSKWLDPKNAATGKSSLKIPTSPGRCKCSTSACLFENVGSRCHREHRRTACRAGQRVPEE